MQCQQPSAWTLVLSSDNQFFSADGICNDRPISFRCGKADHHISILRTRRFNKSRIPIGVSVGRFGNDCLQRQMIFFTRRRGSEKFLIKRSFDPLIVYQQCSGEGSYQDWQSKDQTEPLVQDPGRLEKTFSKSAFFHVGSVSVVIESLSCT